jgi:fatty acid desaturase
MKSIASGELKIRRLNPTVMVFVGAFVLFHLNLAIAFYFHPLPAFLLATIFGIQVITIFIMFTPLHDAVHYAASKKRWVNELIMHGTWTLFINHPALFRKIHLSHHARTNQGKADPDHFTSAQYLTGNAATAEQWVRSFLLIFYYYVYSVKNYGPREYFWMAVSAASMAAMIWLSIHGPYTSVFLWAWFGPSLSAIGFLAFANTAWPHHPGKETSRYRNTRVLMVPRVLRLLMLNQNLHLVHHLRPTIPWYEYPAFWAQNKDRILAEGGQIAHFGVIPSFENEEIEGKYVTH